MVVFNDKGKSRQDFLSVEHEFTLGFAEVYHAILHPSVPPNLSPEEKKRRDAVRLELAQGRPTLVDSGTPRHSSCAGWLASSARAAASSSSHVNQNTSSGPAMAPALTHR